MAALDAITIPRTISMALHKTATTGPEVSKGSNTLTNNSEMTSRTNVPAAEPTMKAYTNKNIQTKKQIKPTASETKTAQEKSTSMTPINQPAAIDISRTLSNNINNSKNTACAHPPKGETRSDREIVETWRIGRV